MEENQNPQGGLFVYGTWTGMEEMMKKHGKIRTLHRAVLIFLAVLSLISGSIFADLCTERVQEQKQEIQKQEQEIQKQEQQKKHLYI